LISEFKESDVAKKLGSFAETGFFVDLSCSQKELTDLFVMKYF